MKPLLLALSLVSPAHDWYPPDCCSGKDCGPLALHEVPTEVAGGFQLPDGRHVPYQSLRPSPDRQWHVCEQQWPVDRAKRKLLCVYAPIGGV